MSGSRALLLLLGLQCFLRGLQFAHGRSWLLLDVHRRKTCALGVLLALDTTLGGSNYFSEGQLAVSSPDAVLARGLTGKVVEFFAATRSAFFRDSTEIFDDWLCLSAFSLCPSPSWAQMSFVPSALCLCDYSVCLFFLIFPALLLKSA